MVSDVHSNDCKFVTARLAGQLFGIPIDQVDEVFLVGQTTPVPLARPEIAGALNLRGRVVTTIDTRRLIDLPAASEATKMAVGIEWRKEPFGLLVDEVGDVLSLSVSERESPPANLDRRWLEVIAGVYRLPDELLLEFDVARALSRVALVTAG